MSNKRVIVLNGESRQALTVIRSLGSAGYKIFVGSNNKNALSFYSHFVTKRFIYPDFQKNREKSLQIILSLAKKNNIKIILPILEDTILTFSHIKKDLNSDGFIIPIPDPSALKVAIDKYSTYNVAKSLGIPVPKTIIIQEKKNIEIGDMKYPIILKVPQERGIPPSRRFVIVRNESELKKKIGNLQKLSNKLILQEFISGIGVGSFFLFNKHKDLIASFGHKRIFESCYSGVSIVCEKFLDTKIYKYGFNLLKYLGWKGVAMVEFRLSIDTGTPYLLEINPRFWGSLPLAIKAGIDFPRLLIETWNQKNYHIAELYRTIITDLKTNQRIRYILLSPFAELLINHLSRRKLKAFKRDIFKLLKYWIPNLRSTYEYDYVDFKPFLMLLVNTIL